MQSDEELRKRIDALEQENRALREAAIRPGKRNVIAVSEGTYQGHPTITFEAGGRPFTLGLRKAAVLLCCTEQVKRFVRKHNAEIKDMEVLRASRPGGDVEWRPDLQI